jgi:hypothetical protein
MEGFTCPKCGRTTYTAYREAASICPYCTTEKLLILNPRLLKMGLDITDARILVDRRNTHAEVEPERRQGDEFIPIAWLVIRNRPLSDAG